MRTLAEGGVSYEETLLFSTQKFLLEGISTRRAEFASVSAGLVSVRAKVIAAQLPPASSEGGVRTLAHWGASCKRRSSSSLRWQHAKVSGLTSKYCRKSKVHSLTPIIQVSIITPHRVGPLDRSDGQTELRPNGVLRSPLSAAIVAVTG